MHQQKVPIRGGVTFVYRVEPVKEKITNPT